MFVIFLKSSFSVIRIGCFEEVTKLEKLAENKDSNHIIVKSLEDIVPICNQSIAEYQPILP